MPNLDKKGKLQFHSKDQLSMSSSGSGSFLKSLGRDGLLKILVSSGIEYINVLGTRDFNSKFCDPLRVGFMEHKKTECIFDVFRRESLSVKNPSILEDVTGALDMYYADQSRLAVEENESLFPKYGITDLNMFCTLEFLTSSLRNNSAEIFKFRLKKKNIKVYDKEVETIGSQGLNSLSFELNAFNLIKLTNNIKIFVTNAKEKAMFCHAPESIQWNLDQLLKKLKFLYDLRCKELNKDPGIFIILLTKLIRKN